MHDLKIDVCKVISFIKENDVYKITYKEREDDKEIHGGDLLNKYIRFVESNDDVSELLIHVDVNDERQIFQVM